MNKEGEYYRNSALYAGKEAAYNAALPFISGTLIQLFLAHKGISSEKIGLFNTAIFLINLAASVLLSGIAERKPDALRQSNRILLVIAGCYLLYLPTGIGLAPTVCFWVLLAAAAAQTVLAACKSVFEYKLLYQIIPIHRYGKLAASSGLAIGVVGAVMSLLSSRLIAMNDGDLPYLIGMLLSAAMLWAAAFCSCRLRPVNQLFQEGSMVPIGRLTSVLRRPEFRKLVIPNTMRGITIGVSNSIALIALGMGYSSAAAAKTAVLCSVGYIGASFLYYVFGVRLGPRVMGIAGSLLLCGIAFLPTANERLFFILILISYLGRTMVDYAVPVMVFEIVDPQISGVYNAWRWILSTVAAAGASYVVGAVTGRFSPLWYLLPCAAAYLISMIWYCLFDQKRRKQSNIVSEATFRK